MFVLILIYKVFIEKVIELLEVYCCYLDKYYVVGIFFVFGLQVFWMGGVIFCCVQSCVEVEKIIGEDFFNVVVDYWVIEFELNKLVEGFKEFLKIG